MSPGYGETISFDDVCPLDYRYYKGNQLVFESLRGYLSEDAYVRYQLRVEAALGRVMAQVGICPRDAADAIEAACKDVTTREVYEEEARIHHGVRALVNCIRRRLPDSARPYVHLFLTSSDVMDTATALRLKDLSLQVLLPHLLALEELLIRWARETRDYVQIGRTHGQHAVPITFGFGVASYVSRLGNRIEGIERAAVDLRGKISGAVGAYNAYVLASGGRGVTPQQFEAAVLAELGLEPGDHSTQIVAPEYVTDLVYAVVSCFSVLANIADDMRHLMRTEIREVVGEGDPSEVGSSTMPHKANPFRFEAVKSMWKAFMPRMVTTLMDQVSEHQRDLTNGASSRFTTELFAGFAFAVVQLRDALNRVRVDPAALDRHVKSIGPEVVSEALYTLLALRGHGDAHEHLRRCLQEARESGRDVVEAVEADLEIVQLLDSIDARHRELLRDPTGYRGIAAEKTEEVCALWDARLLGEGGLRHRVRRRNGGSP